MSTFGAAVALSADGRTALIGTPQEHAPGDPFEDTVGAAYVLAVDADGRFRETRRLTAGNVEQYFGACGALSGDGKLAVIGDFKHAFVFPDTP